MLPLYEEQTGTDYQIRCRSLDPRTIGCIMIGFMPDEGLEEALFSLRDMLDFYGHKPSPRPAKLAPKALDATIADRKKRPDIILTE